MPILHKMSKKELAKESAQLADLAELNTREGIETIADKLNRKIRGIKTIYNFESGEELSSTISALSKSMQAKESLLEEEYEEMRLVILTRIYLIAQGYRMAYIPFHPLSVSLSSRKEETMIIIEKCVEHLIRKKLIESRAWGMISVTHKGIKEIENLLEESFHKKSSTSERKKRIASQIKHSIGESKLSEVREIQRLRYDILERASLLAGQRDEAMNIFTIGQPLGIEKEKLDRIYFYLEDEGLTKFHAIGGYFFITDKGLKRAKDGPNRIL